jgi:hypothetical protein
MHVVLQLRVVPLWKTRLQGKVARTIPGRTTRKSSLNPMGLSLPQSKQRECSAIFIASSVCCAAETAVASGILSDEKSFIGYFLAAIAASWASCRR